LIQGCHAMVCPTGDALRRKGFVKAPKRKTHNAGNR
jgi:hypothetical protein